jgi:hypothetical protein
MATISPAAEEITCAVDMADEVAPAPVTSAKNAGRFGKGLAWNILEHVALVKATKNVFINSALGDQMKQCSLHSKVRANALDVHRRKHAVRMMVVHSTNADGMPELREV